MKHRAQAIALVLALAGLLCAGCSTVTVGKSKMLPLHLAADQSLRLKFWRLEFTATTETGELDVKGAAFPLREKLPDWADWIDDFKLTAYLCDNNGQVLASEETAYQPRPLEAPNGIPFRFGFKKDAKANAATNITFGYQSRITARKRPPGAAQEFFASEPALVRY